MKVLKAKICITHENGATQYIGYPKIWLDNKEKIPMILYPNDRSDEILNSEGKLCQIVFPVVPDDLATELLKLPDFELANKLELEAYAMKHAPIEEVVRNEKKVLAITSKAARGETLTQLEKDALNPDHPEPGINKSRSWVDMAEKDYGVIF